MKQFTISFCVRDGKVLLALKKKKIGAGWLNGYGGKVEEHDFSVAESAIRELQEESNIRARIGDVEKVAHIAFCFEGIPKLECHIFIVRDWTGEPVETDEMGAPEWYPIDSLPEEKMWIGDRLWLPRVLRGETLSGFVDYNADGKEVLNSNFKPEEF